MRKEIVIVLIIVAVVIYVWDMRLLIREAIGSHTSEVNKVLSVKSQEPQIQLDNLLKASVQYKEKGKSPFLAYSKKPESAAPKEKTVVRKEQPQQKQEVNAPQITITGIMWNPANPVVMLSFPGGASTVAKKGQMLQGEIQVVSIEKDKIHIKYKGSSFWIKK